MANRREYKSGTAWCFWRWTDVASEYIVRLHVVKTPWFAICVHWFHKPDPEPFDHDHPVTFLSLILRGCYVERRNGELKTRAWVNFIRASEADQHTIVALAGDPVSLCFMGPKRREWGFHRPQGWIGWKAYYVELRAKADRNPKGGDAKQAPSRSDESGGRAAICPNDTGV